MIIHTSSSCKLSILTCFFLFGLWCSFQENVEGNENHGLQIVQVESTPQENQCDDSTQVCFSSVDKAKNEQVDIFEPTHEWKDILPNQQIPAGLHIRMNLQTGKKEAKLIDDNDNTDVESHPQEYGEKGEDRTKKTTSLESAKPTKSQESNEDFLLKGDEMYRVLSALPEPPKVDEMSLQEAHDKLSVNEFRKHMISLWKERQSMLKDAMKSMLNEASEIQKLIERLIAPLTSVQEQENILELLEWEVQDLDKAKDFNKLGGLAIAVRYLNSSYPGLQSKSAWVIGSTVKHYKEAQFWALDYGVVLKILQALDAFQDTTKETMEVQKKMLYALGSVVRFNEGAQAQLLLHGGLEILSKLLKHKGKYFEKIHLKILDLVYDLLQESETSSNESISSIREILQSDLWCQLTPLLLNVEKSSFQRRVLLAMSSQASGCTKIFNRSDNIKRVHVIRKKLLDEAMDENEEELINLCDKILE